MNRLGRRPPAAEAVPPPAAGAGRRRGPARKRAGMVEARVRCIVLLVVPPLSLVQKVRMWTIAISQWQASYSSNRIRGSTAMHTVVSS